MFDEILEKCILESEDTGTKFYHVSPKNLGDEIILKPRNPQAPGEPTTPRICVTPTIAGCIMATGSLLQLFAEDTLYVYQTIAPVEAKKPVGVEDASMTGELWILEDTKFKKIDEINIDDLPNKLWREVISYNLDRNRSQVRDDLSAELEKLH